MKYIQKFNENKNYNDVPEEIWNKIDSLHNRLVYISKKFIQSELSKIVNISDDDDIYINTNCDFKIDIPIEKDFEKYITDYINENKEAYFVEYDRPFLIFKDNDFKYEVPLNLYAGYKDGWENNEKVSYMKYNVWINKNVMKKTKLS